MDPSTQKLPPEEQRSAPNVDDLIAHANAETYAFEHGSMKHSPKQWFSGLSRTRKLLLVGGVVTAVFVVTVLGLTFGKESPKDTTAAITAYGTTDTNGDGVINAADATVSGDTNGDGVVDSRDDTSGNATDSTSATWWNNLFAKANSAIQSNSSDDSSSSSSDDYDSSTNTSDGSDSADDQTTASDTDNDTYAEETDPDEEIAYDNQPSETETDDPVDTSADPAPTAEGGTLLTIASWNILYLNSPAHISNGIKTIFGSAQIIGLQEVGTNKTTANRNTIKNLSSSSIGVYQPDGSTPIIWNAKMYTKKASGVQKISAYGVLKYATYVKLRNKATGQQLYVFNFHAVVGTNGSKLPSEGCGSAVCKAYKYEMKALSKFIASKKSENIPIFVTGDYNANYRLDSSCKLSWYPCKTFASLEFRSGYAYTGLAGIVKTDSSVGSSSSIIDYVFSWQRNDVSPIAMQIVAPGASCTTEKSGANKGQKHCWNNSDHRPVLFTVKLTN